MQWTKKSFDGETLEITKSDKNGKYELIENKKVYKMINYYEIISWFCCFYRKQCHQTVVLHLETPIKTTCSGHLN